MLYHALQSQAAHAGVSARLRRKIDVLSGKAPAPRKTSANENDTLPLFREVEHDGPKERVQPRRSERVRTPLGVGDAQAMTRMPFTKYGFKLRPVSEIIDQLSRAGFSLVEDRRIGDDPLAFHVIVTELHRPE